MKSDNTLVNLYQLYETGNMSKKDLEGRIFRYLFDNFKRYRVLSGNRDQWEDFLGWAYPRLVKAIDLYKNQGSSFDAYITGLVYCASKEYRNREIEHCLTEYECWKVKAEEVFLRENEPEYSGQKKELLIPEGIKPRQILFLLLKSYFFVTDDFVEKIALAIGINPEVIWSLIEELKKMSSKKENEIYNLRERIHSQHYRCLAYQKRLSYVLPGTEYYTRLNDRLERARKRFHSMRKRLKGIRMGATNKMIAKVLGIPKGTVDTALSVVKNRRLGMY